MINCPLCRNTGEEFYQYKKQLYYRCANCYGIFVAEHLRPSISAEKQRYETHNNDVNDLNYQQFVSPITSAILNTHKQKDIGLDFGAGTGPVISKVLADNNYQILQYDPLFHPYPKLLDGKYDYIACCEVIEHFYNPHKEFKLLKDLLNKKGVLYCMTDIYNDNIDFHKWYYKNDPTHVFIYQQQTFDWLQGEFSFTKVTLDHRLITFYN
jgi:hypothetical protein